MIRHACSLVLLLLGLTTHAIAQGSDDCSSPTPIAGVGVYAFDLTGATSTPPFGSSDLCSVSGNLQNDRFFVFTSPTTGRYIFKTCGGTNVQTAIAAYAGDDCNATCLEWNDDDCSLQSRVWFDATAGSSYLLQVGRFNVGTAPLGSGTFDLSALPPPPANNTCATPTQITGTGSTFYNRTNATTSGFAAPSQVGCPSPSFLPTFRDCFFQWTATADGDYTISNCGTGSNATINVLEGIGCSATCSVTSIDAGCNFGGDLVSLSGVTAGDQYLIQIGDQWAHTNVSAATSLVVTQTQVVAGDDCSDPVALTGPGPYPFDSTFAQSDAFFGGSAACSGSFAVGTPAKDLFFKWTAPWSGAYRIPFPESLMKVNVHLGQDCNATCLASATWIGGNSQPVTFNAVAGQTYLIQMGSADPNGAAYQTDFEVEILSLDPIGPGVDVVCRPAFEHGQNGVATLATSSLSGTGGADLRLRCTDGPAGEFGFYLMSAGAAGNHPIENGVLCLDVPFARYNGQVAAAMGVPGLNSLGRFNANGTMLTLFGPSAGQAYFEVPDEIPGGFPGQVFLPGDVRFFQCWFRDPVPGGGASNLSDAARVTFP